jgi:pyrroloquinoline-quinone synthase
MRSEATLIQVVLRGNGGAGMVAGWARTDLTVTSRRVDLWSRLDDVHRRWDVLDHPFYQRWSRGELSAAELALYAGQYRHAVVALARAADSTARASASLELAAHAGEEAAHVALWDAFAAAAGAGGPADAEPETAECADAWAGEDRDLLGHLVAMYAIESAQPAISRVKADGLRDHYGFAAGLGTAYFDLHAERDVEHAEDARALIAERLDGADEDALVAEAERVLRANWRLLDGVERLCAD